MFSLSIDPSLVVQNAYCHYLKEFLFLLLRGNLVQCVKVNFFHMIHLKLENWTELLNIPNKRMYETQLFDSDNFRTLFAAFFSCWKSCFSSQHWHWDLLVSFAEFELRTLQSQSSHSLKPTIRHDILPCCVPPISSQLANGGSSQSRP